MAILGKNIIKTGPYIDFVRFGHTPDMENHRLWKTEEYKSGIFFQMSDALVDLLCSITQNYMIFDPNCCVTIYCSRQDLYDLSAEFILWTYRLAKIPENYYWIYIDRYGQDGLFEGYGHPEPARLKADLIETLLHISSEINGIARDAHTLVINGL